MGEVIKLKTYGFDYVEKGQFQLVEVTNAEGKTETKKEPLVKHWFITVKADKPVAEIEKLLSAEHKQPIKLTLENEFEIKRPSIPLNPKEDSMYSKEPNDAPEAQDDGVIDMPLDLDVGDTVKHPTLGEGEVVDYYVSDYSKYEKHPKPLFCYVISFDKDKYVDDAGKLRRPTRMFTPRDLYEVIKAAQEAKAANDNQPTSESEQ